MLISLSTLLLTMVVYFLQLLFYSQNEQDGSFELKLYHLLEQKRHLSIYFQFEVSCSHESKVTSNEQIIRIT
jgi:hypothetical protein